MNELIEKLKDKGLELGEPNDLEVLLGKAKSYDELKAIMKSDDSFERVFEGVEATGSTTGAPPLP